MGKQEHQADQWQKIIRTRDDELETEDGSPARIRRYLDLADVLIKRVQRRGQRTRFKNVQNRRDAA